MAVKEEKNMTMTEKCTERFISTLSRDEIDRVMNCNTLEDFADFLSEYGFDIAEYLCAAD